MTAALAARGALAITETAAGRAVVQGAESVFSEVVELLAGKEGAQAVGNFARRVSTAMPEMQPAKLLVPGENGAGTMVTSRQWDFSKFSGFGRGREEFGLATSIKEESLEAQRLASGSWTRDTSIATRLQTTAVNNETGLIGNTLNRFMTADAPTSITVNRAAFNDGSAATQQFLFGRGATKLNLYTNETSGAFTAGGRDLVGVTRPAEVTSITRVMRPGTAENSVVFENPNGLFTANLPKAADGRAINLSKLAVNEEGRVLEFTPIFK